MPVALIRPRLVGGFVRTGTGLRLVSALLFAPLTTVQLHGCGYRNSAFILLRSRLMLGYIYEAEDRPFGGAIARGMNEADTYRRFIATRCRAVGPRTNGDLQLTLPDVPKVPPILQRGNVNEIISEFGGADQLRDAVSQLKTMLCPT